MTMRRWNWDTELARWAESQVGRPFEWGETDCGSLVRHAVEVMYGRHMVAGVPSYRSTEQAAAVLARRGGVAAHLLELHAVRVEIPFLQAGDIVIILKDAERADGACVAVAGDLLDIEEGGTVERISIGVAVFPSRTFALRLPHG